LSEARWLRAEHPSPKKLIDGAPACEVRKKHEHDAHHKTPVAHAVGDERLLRGVAGFLAIDVITNEQV